MVELDRGQQVLLARGEEYIQVGECFILRRKYERAKEIAGLRSEGLSLRQVGDRVGLSAERTRQYTVMWRRWHDKPVGRIVTQADLPTAIRDIEPEHSELQVRTFNCLCNLFGRGFTAEMVAAMKPWELLAVPAFGRKSLRDVEEWLERRGLHLAGQQQPVAPPPPNPKVIEQYVKYLRKHGWTVEPPEDVNNGC